MYHRVRRKMHWHFTLIAILILEYINVSQCKSIDVTDQYKTADSEESFDNNIIDFDSVYNDKLSKQYGPPEWHENKKETHRYTVIKANQGRIETKPHKEGNTNDNRKRNDMTLTTESSFMPVELISTTEDAVISPVDSTEAIDLTVIPLSSTQKSTPGIEISTIIIPTSTPNTDTSTNENYFFETTDSSEYNASINTNTELSSTISNKTASVKNVNFNLTSNFEFLNSTTEEPAFKSQNETNIKIEENTHNSTLKINSIVNNFTKDITKDNGNLNSTKTNDTIGRHDENGEVDVPIFTELDVDDEEVPEDYYDAKDVIPTKPPNVDALSIIFGLAGSVVESVAERVVPKGIFNLYKRMQKQNEALEAERLRSREENGGLGQFGRGILKTISTGLSAPFTQLMAGARDNGSLDSDRGFVSGVASGVSNVANSLVDAFKTRVQAIYPGTLWCGDGHSAQARSGDLGLFFFTDTCCRQHDACKLYIRSGETKHGLTNTGLFTRSHCSCDLKFRSCLQKTGSLVSGQIGLTYFNVLGPQCFRKTHPIIRCVRRTRITGQKCEEYELDYTKPKMWQWFDNETF